MAIRRLCRTTHNLGKRCLLLSDSMVSILALSEGCSSSGGINKVCRRAAAYLVCGSIGLHIRHISTKGNPADAPSRWHGDNLPKPVLQQLPTSAASGAVSTELGQCEQEKKVTSAGAFNQAGPPGFLELFSGAGKLTEHVKFELKGIGLKSWPPFDIAAGSVYNLLNPGVQKFVLSLVSAGLVWWVHLGTPCTAWSKARHNIRNMQKACAKEREAVGTLFTCRIIRECLKRGIVFTLENPRSSRLWEFAPIVDLLRDPRIHLFSFDMCQYGEPHKKSTSIMTNETAFNKLQKTCSEVIFINIW